MRRTARWLVIAALVIGYPVLAHYTNHAAVDGAAGHLGALVAIAPFLLIALVLAWRSPLRWLMLGLLASCCIALYAAWPLLAQHFGVIYWLQHAAIYLMLGVVFGRTLSAGRMPLCTRLARIVHAPATLSTEHERYTRQVTLAWTVFFIAMAAVSTLLFFLTPLSTWSIFANFISPALVMLMFIVEYRVRYWLLPQAPRTHFLDAIKAYQNSGSRPNELPRS